MAVRFLPSTLTEPGPWTLRACRRQGPYRAYDTKNKTYVHVSESGALQRGNFVFLGVLAEQLNARGLPPKNARSLSSTKHPPRWSILAVSVTFRTI